MLRHHPPTKADIEASHGLETCVQRPESAPLRGQGTSASHLYRQRLADYFFDRGQISFQWDQTFRTR